MQQTIAPTTRQRYKYLKRLTVNGDTDCDGDDEHVGEDNTSRQHRFAAGTPLLDADPYSSGVL